jgi:uracil-DNA glycosylase family protein
VRRDDKPIGAEHFLPTGRKSLSGLRKAAADCQGCPLYEPASQTVFGAGPARARLMLIGETPGDYEDQAGEPFVGPAGRVLDRVLEDVGLDRDQLYLTNAVKHFKFVQRGKRRLHKTPSQAESTACAPWWRAEIAAVRPELLVCLGAVAAKAVLGPAFRVTKQHGQILAAPDSLPAGLRIVATVHPSAVLRAEDRDTVYKGLRDDLVVARKVLDG